MKVIIAIDDSPMTETVIANVLSRRWPEDTQFKILTVLEPLCISSEESDYSDALVQVYDKRKSSAAKWCEKLRERLESHITSAHVHYDIREGQAPGQIIDAAVEWSADKILIGAHGQNVCPHNLVGSVSRRVASHAPCSVEIIRSKVQAAKGNSNSKQSAVASKSRKG